MPRWPEEKLSELKDLASLQYRVAIANRAMLDRRIAAGEMHLSTPDVEQKEKYIRITYAALHQFFNEEEIASIQKKATDQLESTYQTTWRHENTCGFHFENHKHKLK